MSILAAWHQNEVSLLVVHSHRPCSSKTKNKKIGLAWKSWTNLGKQITCFVHRKIRFLGCNSLPFRSHLHCWCTCLSCKLVPNKRAWSASKPSLYIAPSDWFFSMRHAFPNISKRISIWNQSFPRAAVYYWDKLGKALLYHHLLWHYY